MDKILQALVKCTNCENYREYKICNQCIHSEEGKSYLLDKKKFRNAFYLREDLRLEVYDLINAKKELESIKIKNKKDDVFENIITELSSILGDNTSNFEDMNLEEIVPKDVKVVGVKYVMHQDKVEIIIESVDKFIVETIVEGVSREIGISIADKSREIIIEDGKTTVNIKLK